MSLYEKIQQKTEKNPPTSNTWSNSRYIGRSTHQVPVEIGSTQGKTLAIRWLLGHPENVWVEIWLSN